MTEAPTTDAIQDKLAAVRARIAEAAIAAGRSSHDVTLVAVTKTHGADTVRPALLAGQVVFGENRVQEAWDKWPALKAQWPEVRLHLIGPLQRNKARRAVALFDAIETVDRPSLARTLADVMEQEGRRPDLFIQVNTGAEPQKAGVVPQDADGFIRECCDRLSLPVVGLMCIPPVDEEPSGHFALLREIADRNGLPHSSMGMTADYHIAIGCGATFVRVGTAIFGDRPARET